MTFDVNISENDMAKLKYFLAKSRKGKLNFAEHDEVVQAHREGFDGFSAFVVRELAGEPVQTRHPRILDALFTAAKSVEDFANCIAKDYSDGLLSFSEVEGEIKRMGLPDWIGPIIRKKKDEIFNYGG